jgi:hypothetical protein
VNLGLYNGLRKPATKGQNDGVKRKALNKNARGCGYLIRVHDDRALRIEEFLLRVLRFPGREKAPGPRRAGGEALSASAIPQPGIV